MAEEWKAKGNEALKAKDFDSAIKHYSEAISLDGTNHIYFSNRSAAYLSKGDGENARADGEQCITLKPDWPKGYSRKGAALHKLSRLQDAIDVYKLGLETCPNDATLMSALKSVQALQASSEAATHNEVKSTEKTEENTEEVPEWKKQSEEYKTEGNTAFKNGEHKEAIRLYTLAIDLDPDNAVLYSNRSAAYLASGDAMSKALADSVKCIDLRPDWGKGYSRRGAAEHALGRFDAAIATFNNALRMDPNDKALQAGLVAAKQGQEKARLAKVEAARKEYEAFEAQKKAKLEMSDVLLDDLFGDITSEEEKREAAKREAEATARKAQSQTVKQDKFTKQELETSTEIIARLTTSNRSYRNLNPYWVLQLDIDATIEDIKFRYKKMSLLVHPDKNLGVEGCQIAFDEVKKSYEELCDETKRDLVIDTIDNTRAKVSKEMRRLLRKGMKEEEMEPLEVQQEKEVMKAFADIELRRRDSAKHLATSKKREREQEDEEKKKEKAEAELDKKWTEGDRVDERINDWRGFSKDNKKVDLKNYKQQERTDSKKPKFGGADMESWKKSWK